LPHLERFAQTVGLGVTSLPNHSDLLEEKLQRAVQSFGQKKKEKHPLYLFVLEDLETGESGGTCAIEASTFGSDEGYCYRLEDIALPKVHPLTRPSTKILHPMQKRTTVSEVCGLYLLPKFRREHYGRLLSLSRFLFMASFPDLFQSKVIAQLRG